MPCYNTFLLLLSSLYVVTILINLYSKLTSENPNPPQWAPGLVWQWPQILSADLCHHHHHGLISYDLMMMMTMSLWFIVSQLYTSHRFFPLIPFGIFYFAFVVVVAIGLFLIVLIVGEPLMHLYIFIYSVCLFVCLSVCLIGLIMANYKIKNIIYIWLLSLYSYEIKFTQHWFMILWPVKETSA